ncbi:MAG TPA: hypothetical protein VFY96_03205 [Candidatus Binatia bacterium]|nr:hypothetical protein [Candidatus Binatia bacterium]
MPAPVAGPASDFLGLGSAYFRIDIKQRQENRRLIAALVEWLRS